MAAEKENKVVPLTEEQLLQKEAELNSRAKKLDSDIKEFEDFQEGVHELSEKTNSDIQKLAEEREHFEAEKAAFEKEKEEALNNVKSSEPVEESQQGLAFSFENEDYKFSDDTPENILFNGKAFTQEELSRDEEALLQLIGGNSGLIIKI